jgi:hypothetical protein
MWNRQLALQSLVTLAAVAVLPQLTVGCGSDNTSNHSNPVVDAGVDSTANTSAGEHPCGLGGDRCADRPCCSGVCNDGICVCTEADGNCQRNTDCCSGVCGAGKCAACNPPESICETHANCCDGYCDNGICKSLDVCVNFCNKVNDPTCGGAPNDACVENCSSLLSEWGECSSEIDEYISCVAWKATIVCGEYGAEPKGCGEESFAEFLCRASPRNVCGPEMPPPPDDASCNSRTDPDGICVQYCSHYGYDHWNSTCFNGRCVCEYNDEVVCEVQSDSCSCFGL